jgi:hypothetical protein
MSEENWTVPETPAYVLCNPPAQGSDHKGLLWGNGDPEFALLQADDYWAVVKVRCYREIEEKGRRCVEFKDHETIFEGTRADAIKTLIGLGADPARISVELQIKEAAEKFNYAPVYIRTGDCGTSIVTDHGIARAGRRGHATAKCDGIDLIDMLGCIAWAGPHGRAEAGDSGVAIIGGSGTGTAIAGDGGMALSPGGGFQKLLVGKAGKAVTEFAGNIWVGDFGIGVCKRTGTVYGGSESIVIGELVSGGPGSLLVARKRTHPDGEWQVAYGVAGKDGIKPNTKYTVEDNRLVERTDEQLQEEIEEKRRHWIEAVAAAKKTLESGDPQPDTDTQPPA